MKKYKVSQELMNEIDEWKFRVGHLVIGQDLMAENILPSSIDKWWVGSSEYNSEKNNRLIALIKYVNGEDVFEVEKPKKWIVRSKGTDDDDDHSYVFIDLHNFVLNTYHISNATKFDTKEEAEQFSNPLMEVVEVEDD